MRAADIYRSLLVCYPASFRDEYGHDMVDAFESQLHEAARRGVVLSDAEAEEATRGMAPTEVLAAQAVALEMSVATLVARRREGLRAQRMLIALLAREAPARFAPSEAELRGWFEAAPWAFAEPERTAMPRAMPAPGVAPLGMAAPEEVSRAAPRFEAVRDRVRARWIGRAVMELAPGFLARLRASAVIERKEGVSV